MNEQSRRWAGLAACVLLTLLIWFMPAPAGLETQAWRILGVFAGVIAALILRPFPMGAAVVFGLAALMTTQTVDKKEALAGYGDSVVWLVAAAFLFANAVVTSGLGKRIALTLVDKWGGSMIGLGYAVCGAELILGPAIPSNTARGGGVLSPIVRSLAEALDSHPDNNSERAGQYLIQLGAHANLIAAAMFLTGMAANPLVQDAAKEVLDVEFTWATWAWGALAPGLFGLGILPWFIRWLAKPTVEDTRPAQKAARLQLEEMGPWSRREIGIGVIFAGMIFLWATHKYLHGLGSTEVAWLGVAALLLTGFEDWSAVIKNSSAWDAVVWLGGLLSMATLLREKGVASWFGDQVGGWASGFGATAAIVVLAVVYFYSMYGFSMLTGHIMALAGVFLSAAAGAGAPAMASVALIAYFSNLCGCLTNYSTGPFVIYFSFRYVPAPRWFRTGFAVSLMHMAVWLGVGGLWWKLIGWW